jgi:hypothetical protein
MALGRRIDVMIGGLIQIGAVLGMLGLMMLGAHLILQSGRGLNVGLFRPWRGDPWPRGVQEEEPVRFDLVGAERRRRARLAPHFPPADIVATVSPDPLELESRIEETRGPAGSRRLEPLHAVVRRLRH